MHVFGLTGGIASGKSTVSARFAARGVAIVDADRVAREVTEPGSEGLAAIAKEFGAGVLAPDGTLDRKALAAQVFGDDARRKTLNGILHPLIARTSASKLAELGARGEDLAVYDAALLVENGLQDAFRPLVVVATPESLQIARICARDGGTEEEARARVRAQKPLEEKVAVADFVIDNAGPLDQLLARADEVLDGVCDRVGVPRRRPVLV